MTAKTLDQWYGYTWVCTERPRSVHPYREWEDIVQSVMESVWKAQLRGKPDSWIARMISKMVWQRNDLPYSVRKNMKERREAHLTEEVKDLEEGSPLAMGRMPDIDVATSQARVDAFLSALTEDQRQLVEALMAGHTAADVGRSRGVSQQAMSSMLRTVRKAWHRFVEEESKDE